MGEGMEVEYKKDLHHSYLVISPENDISTRQYCIKLLEHERVEGILPLERRVMDNESMLYYEITSKQVMQSLLIKTTLSCRQLKSICGNILLALERAYEYLLPEDDFVLSPEHIYLDVSNFEPGICFLPGYQKNIREQVRGLMEYLMNKIDYTDKEAVLLVYQLYAVSREEDYCFEALSELIGGTTASEEAVRPKLRQQKEGLNSIETGNRKEEEGGARKESGKESKKDIKDIRKDIKDIRKDNAKESIKGNSKENIKHNIKQSLQQNIKENERQMKSGIIRTDLNIEREQADMQRSVITAKRERGRIRPSIIEKIEGEREITLYPFKTYLYLGGCAVGGILITVLCIASRILYNSFGNRVDYSKLFAFCLILLCVEGYLVQKILDKKNKITRMVKTQEYVSIGEDPVGKGRGEEGERELERENGRERKRELEEEKGLEYKKKPVIDNTGEKSKKGIIGRGFPIREEYLIYKSGDKFRLGEGYEEDSKDYRRDYSKDYSKEDIEKDIGEDSKDCSYNPTCLLNADPADSIACILKSLNEAYPSITIGHFPFFIGKFRENVDYCIEKDVISRYHAKVTREGEEYYLTDLNSTNGTYLNSEMLLTYQKKEIKFGDEITFANLRYQFLKS